MWTVRARSVKSVTEAAIWYVTNIKNGERG